MSARSRISAIARVVFAAGVVFHGSIVAPSPASAAQGDCSQPATSGAAPTATDCLFILNAAINLATCSADCICAPKGTLPISATDALVCLGHVVGQPVALNCPCGSGTLTTTTTATSSTTSTTATSTTTTLPGVLCSIDTAPCTTSACSCFDVLSGLDYHLGATGSVSGPVGTQLRVNTQLQSGGTINCGEWMPIDASVNPSCDLLGCCQREAGQPESTNWQVYENYDLPCFCPEAPGPLQANYIAQCQLGDNPAFEEEQTTDPCP